MKRIKRLSPIVANQIAAGEVVERPSSVLKELLENSLDAHASQIDVQLTQGGLSEIRVQDNGQGIAKEDLALALARHATSKVETIDDLGHIHSLGFRGEALASIASVAKCVLSSKPKSQKQAFSVAVKGDALEPFIYPAKPIDGTVVEINDLFYNTPARRKFLKSARTEFNHVDGVVKRCAMANPGVGFRLTHNEKKLRDYPPTDFEGRVAQILGKAFLSGASYFEFENTGFKLKGWLGDQQAIKKSNEAQFFFINARVVRDKVTLHAIKNAYFDLGYPVDEGFMSFALFLECPASEVDVNVHPTKHEVRFSDPTFVHDFVQKCVSDALSGTQSTRADVVPKIAASLPKPKVSSGLSYSKNPFSPSLSLDLEVFKPKAVKTNHFFWQHLYINFNETMRLIHLPQAKDEIWDEVIKRVTKHPIPRRLCLFPYVIKGQVSQAKQLERFGFVLKKNIQNQTIIHEVPCFLDEKMIKDAVDYIEQKLDSTQTLSMFFRDLPWQVFKDNYFSNILENGSLPSAHQVDISQFEELMTVTE